MPLSYYTTIITCGNYCWCYSTLLLQNWVYNILHTPIIYTIDVTLQTSLSSSINLWATLYRFQKRVWPILWCKRGWGGSSWPVHADDRRHVPRVYYHRSLSMIIIWVLYLYYYTDGASIYIYNIVLILPRARLHRKCTLLHIYVLLYPYYVVFYKAYC